MNWFDEAYLQHNPPRQIPPVKPSPEPVAEPVPKPVAEPDSGFRFSERSIQTLSGVHKDLRNVTCRALKLTEVDFTVIEGRRTRERQAELVRAGASRTMNSRHLTGHAVDIAPYIGGHIRWDWPPFYELAKAMKAAAAELGVEIVWGGDWETFRDGPHFQLDWKHYPA